MGPRPGVAGEQPVVHRHLASEAAEDAQHLEAAAEAEAELLRVPWAVAEAALAVTQPLRSLASAAVAAAGMRPEHRSRASAAVEGEAQ